jgi:uncharacterized protein YebE (UPF0316 family)
VIPLSWSETLSNLSLPTIIFIAETTVVTLATIRIIFIARGMKTLASVVGLFEVSIWLFAIGQVMRNLNDLRCSAAFAGGFTLGNYLGVLIHDKMAIGHLVIRIITSKDASELVQGLQTADYGVTCVDAMGAKGPVQIIVTVIKRRDLPRVLEIIKGFDEEVFYSVEDLHSTAKGVFPGVPESSRRIWTGLGLGLNRGQATTVQRPELALATETSTE